MKEKVLREGPRLRRITLLAMVAGIPLVFTRFTADPINVPKLAFLFIGVTLVAGLRAIELLQGASREGLTRLLVPAVAIGGAVTFGWIFAAHRGYSLFGEYQRYQGWLPYVAVVLFGVLLADAFAGRARELAWALFIAAGIVGAYALLQFLGADPLKWALATEETSLATSTLGNPNFVGGFLGIALPIGVALWFLEPARRTWVAILGVFTIAGWGVAQSQGGWAAGLAGALVALGFVFSERFSKVRVTALIIAGLIAVIAAGAVVLSIADPENRTIPGTVRLRGAAWRAATEMVLDAPLTGRGPNAYALEGVQYRSQRDAARFNYNFPDDPHSVVLSLSVAAGIVGLAAYLVLALWTVRRGLQLAGSNVLGGAFFGAALAYFVQSLVSIDELSLRVAFWVVLAGMLVSSLPVPEGERRSPKRKRGSKRGARSEPLRSLPAVVAVGLVGLALIGWSFGFVLADARAGWARAHFASGEVSAGVDDFEKAIGFRADHRYRFQLGDLAGDVATANQDEDLFSTAREAFGYVDDLPHVFGLVNKGRLLDDWLSVDPSVGEEGVASYREAMRLDPLNPLIRVELADILVDLQRPEEALEVLRPAERVAGRRYPSVYGGIAVAMLAIGDEAGAREAAERALEIDEDEPQASSVLQQIGSAGS